MNLSTAAKVGLFTLIGLILLGGMITWKSNILLLAEGTEIVGTFTNIEGLSIGSEVRYRGFNVGKITRIDPGPEDIKVYSIVKNGLKIPADSTLRVAFDGIVGSKYLDIKPGQLTAYYYPGVVLKGISTAGIVDFVDMGTKSLAETRAILETFRQFVENPRMQAAINNAVLNSEKITLSADNLVEELRSTNRGISRIANDPDFQKGVTGTAKETNKTLTSANEFFEGFRRINVKPNAEVSYGSQANAVRGNLDLVLNPADYVRFGLGEGPTRALGVQDIYLTRALAQQVDMKLGVMNSFLGGGLNYHVNPLWTMSGDIYDINNPKPNVPKLRLTSYNALANYVDLMLQADDIANPGRNYSFGVRVKSDR
jgi:phospholipid/cholesterol/gamma-HCH transport system substrate-binding protein